MISIKKSRIIQKDSLLIQRKFAFFPILIRSDLDGNGYCTETKVWLQYYYTWRYSLSNGPYKYVWGTRENRYLSLVNMVQYFLNNGFKNIFTPMNIFTTDAIMNELEKLHPALLPNVEDF